MCGGEWAGFGRTFVDRLGREVRGGICGRDSVFGVATVRSLDLVKGKDSVSDLLRELREQDISMDDGCEMQNSSHNAMTYGQGREVGARNSVVGAKLIYRKQTGRATHGKPIDVGADFVDGARKVVAHVDRQLLHEPRLEVLGVGAGDLDLDHQLARTCPGYRAFNELGPWTFVDENFFHLAFLSSCSFTAGAAIWKKSRWRSGADRQGASAN